MVKDSLSMNEGKDKDLNFRKKCLGMRIEGKSKKFGGSTEGSTGRIRRCYGIRIRGMHYVLFTLGILLTN